MVNDNICATTKRNMLRHMLKEACPRSAKPETCEALRGVFSLGAKLLYEKHGGEKMFRRFGAVFSILFTLTCILPSYPVFAGAGLVYTEPIYPEASAEKVFKKDNVTVDVSNNWLGYIMVKHEPKPGEFITTLTHGEKTYQFNLMGDGEFDTYPLSEGDGQYAIEVYELTVPGTNRYKRIFDNSINVTMPDPHSVFLIPNSYVWFTRESALVDKSEELCEGLSDRYDKISILYEYVSENILYDYIKAVTVAPHYLPDSDVTLATAAASALILRRCSPGCFGSRGFPRS